MIKRLCIMAVVAYLCTGCAVTGGNWTLGLDLRLDPRKPGTVSMAVYQPCASSDDVTTLAVFSQTGPASMWNEDDIYISVTTDDGKTTQSLEVRKGNVAGESAGLFKVFIGAVGGWFGGRS